MQMCPKCSRKIEQDFEPDLGYFYDCKDCDYLWSDVVANAKAIIFHKTLLPINLILFCPECGQQHIDAPEPESNWTNPPHKSHLCFVCKTIWRPADVPTNGVAEIQTKGKNDTWTIKDYES